MTTDQLIIDGRYLGYDNSGVGHNWQPATDGNCPPDIKGEIQWEITEEGQDKNDDFIASNGCHYRWS